MGRKHKKKVEGDNNPVLDPSITVAPTALPIPAAGYRRNSG